MARTVAFLNKKGGVGKTSTVHHLGGTLAKRGLRVLLVDADPQASLTQGLLGPEVAEELDPRETIASILDEDGGLPPARLVRPTAFPNLFILPGSEAAYRTNLTEPWACPGLQQVALRDALAEVHESFDLVLIDCPPHPQLWAWNALAAADGVVVPVQPEDYGAQGLRSIRETIAHATAAVNPRLTIVGYLVSMYQKALSVHVTYEGHLRNLHGGDVFEAVIPMAKDYKEAVTFRRPICDHKPKSAAAKATAVLADEFLARLDDRIAADVSRRVA
jgi:chromosome partitioning protein